MSNRTLSRKQAADRARRVAREERWQAVIAIGEWARLAGQLLEHPERLAVAKTEIWKPDRPSGMVQAADGIVAPEKGLIVPARTILVPEGTKNPEAAVAPTAEEEKPPSPPRKQRRAMRRLIGRLSRRGRRRELRKALGWDAQAFLYSSQTYSREEDRVIRRAFDGKEMAAVPRPPAARVRPPSKWVVAWKPEERDADTGQVLSAGRFHLVGESIRMSAEQRERTLHGHATEEAGRKQPKAA